MRIHTNIYDLLEGNNDKDSTKSPSKGLFALSGISEKQQTEKEPTTSAPISTFGILGMASTEAPRTHTSAPATSAGSGTPSLGMNDHAGENGTTQIMNQIFGGLKGQPRDDLGRYAREVVNAPASGGQKRPLEPTNTTPTQDETKRPSLESAHSALEKTLDNDTPVSVDAETFRQYNAQEIELKQAMGRIKALEEEKVKWDELGRATGTHDVESAKRIVGKATDDYAQGEVNKIQTAIKYLHDLAGRIEAPEWKAHVETTGKQMEEIANNKETILSENYGKNAQPIVSAVVAASYDIQRQVGEANTEANGWRDKYEEERAARMRLEEHLNVLERGNRSATSSWNVHASRDAPSSTSATGASSSGASSSVGGFGLPASSSTGASARSHSSLFSKPANMSGSYTSSNMFTAASSTPAINTSSRYSTVPGGITTSTGVSGEKVHFEGSSNGNVTNSSMMRQETMHHTAVEYANPMDALQRCIDPRMADAYNLTKQHRAHSFAGSRGDVAGGKLGKENAKELRAASILPEDISDWGKVFGRTKIRTPVVGNTVFV
ncbi:MAG: hypothetical protein ACTSUE_26475 [Promethearchaeota archaeon]